MKRQHRRLARQPAQQHRGQHQRVALPRIAIHVHLEGEAADAVSHELRGVVERVAYRDAAAPSDAPPGTDVHHARVGAVRRELLVHELRVQRPPAHRRRVIADLQDARRSVAAVQ